MMLSTPRNGYAVELVQMPQLAEAVDSQDDWTGLTDPAARRKRQNRLNVRAHRRRKALESQAKAPTTSTLTTHSIEQCLYWIEDEQAVSTLPSSFVSTSRKPIFTYGSNPGTRTQPIIFPLSSDHLITLIQFNALRGCLTNFAILGMLETLPADCAEAYDVQPFPTYTSRTSTIAIPPSLEPTALQLTVPHERWIDIIPHARWRDNMILAQGTFDEDELCEDCVGGLWGESSDNEPKGIAAWSDPWDVWGWEVSEGFFKKWGFFLAGCPDVLASSNKHRTARGEEPLVLEL